MTGALKGAIEGAITGAKIGAFTGGLTGVSNMLNLSTKLVKAFGVTKEFAARVINGGINGLVQSGGKFSGFVRGALSSLVPNHILPASRTSPVANFLNNRVRDAGRGYIIDGSDGSDGAKRNTYAGLGNELIGHTIGQISSGGSIPRFRDGAYLYEGRLASPGIAVGNVITIDSSQPTRLTPAQLYAHELGHVENQNQLGITYLPIHILSQGIGFLNLRYGNGSERGFFMENSPFKPVYPYSELYPNLVYEAFSSSGLGLI